MLPWVQAASNAIRRAAGGGSTGGAANDQLIDCEQAGCPPAAAAGAGAGPSPAAPTDRSPTAHPASPTAAAAMPSAAPTSAIAAATNVAPSAAAAAASSTGLGPVASASASAPSAATSPPSSSSRKSPLAAATAAGGTPPPSRKGTLATASPLQSKRAVAISSPASRKSTLAVVAGAGGTPPHQAPSVLRRPPSLVTARSNAASSLASPHGSAGGSAGGSGGSARSPSYQRAQARLSAQRALQSTLRATLSQAIATNESQVVALDSALLPVPSAPTGTASKPSALTISATHSRRESADTERKLSDAAAAHVTLDIHDGELLHASLPSAQSSARPTPMHTPSTRASILLPPPSSAGSTAGTPRTNPTLYRTSSMPRTLRSPVAMVAPGATVRTPTRPPLTVGVPTASQGATPVPTPPHSTRTIGSSATARFSPNAVPAPADHPHRLHKRAHSINLAQALGHKPRAVKAQPMHAHSPLLRTNRGLMQTMRAGSFAAARAQHEAAKEALQQKADILAVSEVAREHRDEQDLEEDAPFTDPSAAVVAFLGQGGEDDSDDPLSPGDAAQRPSIDPPELSLGRRNSRSRSSRRQREREISKEQLAEVSAIRRNSSSSQYHLERQRRLDADAAAQAESGEKPPVDTVPAILSPYSLGPRPRQREAHGRFQLWGTGVLYFFAIMLQICALMSHAWIEDRETQLGVTNKGLRQYLTVSFALALSVLGYGSFLARAHGKEFATNIFKLITMISLIGTGVLLTLATQWFSNSHSYVHNTPEIRFGSAYNFAVLSRDYTIVCFVLLVWQEAAELWTRVRARRLDRSLARLHALQAQERVASASKEDGDDQASGDQDADSLALQMCSQVVLNEITRLGLSGDASSRVLASDNLDLLVDSLYRDKDYLSRGQRRLVWTSNMFFLTIFIGGMWYSYIEDWNQRASIDFVLVTLTTVGYGNMAPKTDIGRIFLFFYFPIGFAVVGLTVQTWWKVVLYQLDHRLSFISAWLSRKLHERKEQREAREREREEHEKEMEEMVCIKLRLEEQTTSQRSRSRSSRSSKSPSIRRDSASHSDSDESDVSRYVDSRRVSHSRGSDASDDEEDDDSDDSSSSRFIGSSQCSVIARSKSSRGDRHNRDADTSSLHSDHGEEDDEPTFHDLDSEVEHSTNVPCVVKIDPPSNGGVDADSVRLDIVSDSATYSATGPTLLRLPPPPPPSPPAIASPPAANGQSPPSAANGQSPPSGKPRSGSVATPFPPSPALLKVSSQSTSVFPVSPPLLKVSSVSNPTFSPSSPPLTKLPSLGTYAQSPKSKTLDDEEEFPLALLGSPLAMLGSVVDSAGGDDEHGDEHHDEHHDEQDHQHDEEHHSDHEEHVDPRKAARAAAATLKEKRKGRARRIKLICALLFALAWVLFSAGLFAHLEGWPYLDAVYFCYVTLTTIGYGDLFPSDASTSFFIWFVIFGLGAITYILTLVTEIMLASSVKTAAAEAKRKAKIQARRKREHDRAMRAQQILDDEEAEALAIEEEEEEAALQAQAEAEAAEAHARAQAAAEEAAKASAAAAAAAPATLPTSCEEEPAFCEAIETCATEAAVASAASASVSTSASTTVVAPSSSTNIIPDAPPLISKPSFILGAPVISGDETVLRAKTRVEATMQEPPEQLLKAAEEFDKQTKAMLEHARKCVQAMQQTHAAMSTSPTASGGQASAVVVPSSPSSSMPVFDSSLLDAYHSSYLTMVRLEEARSKAFETAWVKGVISSARAERQVEDTRERMLAQIKGFAFERAKKQLQKGLLNRAISSPGGMAPGAAVAAMRAKLEAAAATPKTASTTTAAHHARSHAHSHVHARMPSAGLSESEGSSSGSDDSELDWGRDGAEARMHRLRAVPSAPHVVPQAPPLSITALAKPTGAKLPPGAVFASTRRALQPAASQKEIGGLKTNLTGVSVVPQAPPLDMVCKVVNVLQSAKHKMFDGSQARAQAAGVAAQGRRASLSSVPASSTASSSNSTTHHESSRSSSSSGLLLPGRQLSSSSHSRPHGDRRIPTSVEYLEPFKHVEEDAPLLAASALPVGSALVGGRRGSASGGVVAMKKPSTKQHRSPFAQRAEDDSFTGPDSAGGGRSAGKPKKAKIKPRAGWSSMELTIDRDYTALEIPTTGGARSRAPSPAPPIKTIKEDD